MNEYLITKQELIDIIEWIKKNPNTEYKIDVDMEEGNMILELENPVRSFYYRFDMAN